MSKALAKRGLTPKQRLFALEWTKDCNATQAAIRAGYSVKGAKVQGHKLLTNANVLALAQGHLATRLEREEATADRALNEVVALATFDIGRYLEIDEEGNARLTFERLRTSGDLRALADWSQDEVREDSGDRWVRKTRVKFHNKNEALGKLLNYLEKAGLLLPEPGEMQGGFAYAGTANEPATSDANLAALRQICEWLKRAHREENTLEDLIKWLENELRQPVARSS